MISQDLSANKFHILFVVTPPLTKANIIVLLVYLNAQAQPTRRSGSRIETITTTGRTTTTSAIITTFSESTSCTRKVQAKRNFQLPEFQEAIQIYSSGFIKLLPG
ncbi:unnamed protein product [Orchesella dallaii]|uniref:Uncharacterized protein n=1 Tax=Orchesella dallaii TaxID=48710 RepID=A0ABP1QQZ2_9HEXA